MDTPYLLDLSWRSISRELPKSQKMKTIKHLLKGENAQIGTMELVIAVAIGLIVLAAVFSLAPVIGDKIDSSVTVPAGSQWNITENPDIPTGVDIWTDNTSLISLVVLVMIISLAIFYIQRMGGGSVD
jgi:hypothetical protein